jgi:hypothetical protein
MIVKSLQHQELEDPRVQEVEEVEEEVTVTAEDTERGLHLKSKKTRLPLGFSATFVLYTLISPLVSLHFECLTTSFRPHRYVVRETATRIYRLLYSSPATVNKLPRTLPFLRPILQLSLDNLDASLHFPSEYLTSSIYEALHFFRCEEICHSLISSFVPRTIRFGLLCRRGVARRRSRGRRSFR